MNMLKPIRITLNPLKENLSDTIIPENADFRRIHLFFQIQPATPAFDPTAFFNALTVWMQQQAKQQAQQQLQQGLQIQPVAAPSAIAAPAVPAAREPQREVWVWNNRQIMSALIALFHFARAEISVTIRNKTRACEFQVAIDHSRGETTGEFVEERENQGGDDEMQGNEENEVGPHFLFSWLVIMTDELFSLALVMNENV